MSQALIASNWTFSEHRDQHWSPTSPTYLGGTSWESPIWGSTLSLLKLWKDSDADTRTHGQCHFVSPRLDHAPLTSNFEHSSSCDVLPGFEEKKHNFESLRPWHIGEFSHLAHTCIINIRSNLRWAWPLRNLKRSRKRLQVIELLHWSILRLENSKFLESELWEADCSLRTLC